MKTAFAIVFAASSIISGAAYAKDRIPTGPDTNFSIVYTNPGMSREDRLTVPAEYIEPTPAIAEKAQAQLKQEPSLAAGLRTDHINLNDVVAIDTAGDGSKIVYVR